MILMEFLFAPTVPSAPSPKNMARTVSVGSVENSAIVAQAGVGYVIVDADGEMVLAGAAWPVRRRRALTMAGVNSFDDKP